MVNHIGMTEKFYQNRKLWKYAGIIGGGLAMVVIAFALFFPVAYLVGKATDKIGGSLGRKITIEGKADIHWHWRYPEVHLEKIRLTNMQGASNPEMLDVASLDMTFNFWKFLFGRLEIPELTIVNPVLNLERMDATHANWEFPTTSSANMVQHAALPHERGDVPLIGLLRVKEGHITYRNAPRKLDMDLAMDTVEGEQAGPDQNFNFKGTGKLEGKDFILTATGGSLELLRDTSKRFPLQMKIEIGKTIFSIDGTFVDPIQLKDLDAKLHLQGPSLADLFYLMHIPFPPSPSYKLDGHLVKDADKWTFGPFNGSVGTSDLAGDVVYNNGKDRPLLSGKLHSNKMDVKDLGGLIGLAPSTKSQTVGKGTLLPDVPIDLTRLRAGDMDIDLVAKKLIITSVPVTDMTAHIDLKSGLLQLKPVSIGLAGGRADGSLTFDGRKETPDVTMDLDLKRLSLAQFFTGSIFKDFSKGYFGGHIDLSGKGASLAKVLAVSNGRFVVIMEGGKISLMLIEASDIDIAQLTPLILGKDQTTDIRCGVGDFVVRNGQVDSKIFVLDTSDTNLKGDIKMNLKNETIDGKLNARPKDSSLLSLQSDILLTGKLKKPSISIDPVSTGARGAAAVALGFLNPLAALLPFIEIGVGKDSNCAKLINIAETPRGVPGEKPVKQKIHD